MPMRMSSNPALYTFDAAKRAEHGNICGVDEAGRGPLCGPVCVAAVILNPDDPIEGVNDSKKLSEKRREALFDEIIARALCYQIVFISPQEIDERNILWATMDGMAQAVAGLEITPDYVLIDREIKDPFIACVKKWMAAMYGSDPLDNQGYVRMINRKHFDRVMGLIDPAKVVYGGQGDPDSLKIQPTILDGVSPEDPVMQEEIFGPILPILTYDNLQQAQDFINSRPHPLALYLFSEDKGVQERFLRRVPFGGGCINDTIIHLASSRLSFGGVGDSGMGSYHGKASFETFSRRKSIVKKSTWLDLPLRYAPYTEKTEKLLRFFLK